MREKKELEVYLHICNSGITFEVTNSEYGPEIKISSGSFGNMWNEFTVYTDTLGLKALGVMFLKASKLGYNKVYCNSADLSRLDKEELDVLKNLEVIFKSPLPLESSDKETGII
jgi:hypothetical protein